MPGIDWIPGISQIKSGFQLITGDVAGAAETQKNFFQECPVVSQAMSLGQLLAGDEDGAIETQKRCLGTVNNVANGLPVVGHVKGVVHHLCGDHEGGNEALNAATRTTVVMGSGAVAAIATGGLGAIPAGIAAGGAYDTASTLITKKPQGYVAAYSRVAEDPSAGNIFDAVCVHVGDGLTGYSGGKAATKLANRMEINQLKQTNQGQISALESVRDLKQQQLDTGMFSEPQINTGEAISMGKEINALTKEINTLQGKTAPLDLKAASKTDISSASAKGGAFGGTQNEEKKLKTSGTAVIAGAAGATVVMTSTVSGAKKKTFAANHEKQIEDDLEELDIFKLIDNSLDNALIHDFYAKEEAAGYLSKEQKNSALVNFSKQSAGNTSLKTSSGHSVSTIESLMTKKNQFRRDKNNNKLKQLVSQRDWLHVRMPQTFNYTGAILLNHAFNGLYHSVIRHHDEWRNFIPSFETELQHSNFNNLQSHLRNISQAGDYIMAGVAIRDYMGILSDLRRNNFPRFLDVQSSLHGLQLDLYRFIQNNVTYENYLGEGFTANNQVRVFFKVKDLYGNIKVMAIGVSSDMYPAENDFGDAREIRRIETVFIMPWETYKKQHISKLFDKKDFPFKK